MKIKHLHAIWIIALSLLPVTAASAQEAACKGDDRACLLDTLEKRSAQITEVRWRDTTYRELAKLRMTEGQADAAIALIPKIENPDTQALTIRGIAFAAADRKQGGKMDDAALASVFKRLHEEAAKMTHAPSKGIALTYIAMGQAFAGDHTGAMATANGMENPALRNKAHGENAEIQAEQDNLPAALASIAAIDDAAWRDKAHLLIAKIFADRKFYDLAVEASQKIVNPYQQSQAILYIAAKQITPEEVLVTP